MATEVNIETKMLLAHSPIKLELERTMSDDKVEAQLDYWRDVSWTAIIFGALLALSVSVMLHILGIGVTASSVDTSQRASDALYTLGGVSGIWNLVSTAVSLFIGGFVASTLARTFTSGRA